MSPTPEAVAALVAERPGTVWLDGGHRRIGWSILAWDPVEVVTDAADWPAAGRGLGRPGPLEPEVPFTTGVLGYVGYGAGAAVAPVPPSPPTPEPPVWLGRYEGALCYRHTDGSWHPTGSPSRRREAEALLEAAVPLPPPPPPPRPTAVWTMPEDDYHQAVQRILEWIHAGDCYQVNLTRAVHVAGAGAPWPAYRRLRRADASHGAWLALGEQLAVLSNSPELLLEVDGAFVASEPVKGTRPRGADDDDDARLAAELRDAAKDRAELTMIVDLVRNDLGRVARLGSVRTGDRRLVAHPTVHHASQRVEAELDAGHDSWSALAAAFPPGSVTGAPKVRACQRIAELEAEPRGVYCGAIGFASDSGRARWNVAIRTAVVAGDDARFHVGGGVVAASTPAGEWQESEDKAVALRAALIAG